jgi:hypothetical protein
MKPRFWKLKVTAGVGNKGDGPYGMFNHSNWPTQSGYFSHMDSSYQQLG